MYRVRIQVLFRVHSHGHGQCNVQAYHHRHTKRGGRARSVGKIPIRSHTGDGRWPRSVKPGSRPAGPASAPWLAGCKGSGKGRWSGHGKAWGSNRGRPSPPGHGPGQSFSKPGGWSHCPYRKRCRKSSDTNPSPRPERRSQVRPSRSGKQCLGGLRL